MTKTIIAITAKCSQGHAETLRIDGALGLEWAKTLAGLLDGSSPMFIHSPRGTESVIGKCGICGNQINCVIEDAVDRSQRVLSDGSPVTEDHRELDSLTGQQKGYVVLSADERAKGFVRPVRRTYTHIGALNEFENPDNPEMKGRVWTQRLGGCGSDTTMGQAIAETYARDPGFYSGTFCVNCREHRPLNEFVWKNTTEQVGS